MTTVSTCREPCIEPSWKKVIGQEFEKPYMKNLRQFLVKEKQHNKIIYPKGQDIFKELNADLNIPPPKQGCLTAWAKQGVLLLNSVLTVEQGRAASHQGKGWEKFTDQVILELNNSPRPICFVLWGSYAQQKGQVIDTTKHLVIKSAHPSPLSANRGFLGSRPFSKINQFLEKTGQTPIDWRLAE